MSGVAKGDGPSSQMRRTTNVLTHQPHLTPRVRQSGVGFFRSSARCLILSVLVLAFFLFQSAVSAFDTVVLDPGHGGHDRGASIGYVFEKHLALDTARRVEQLLKQAGLKVIMTRSRDVFIPLPGRAEAGNRYGNAIFVSLHYNYNRGGSGSGVETYYKHSSSYSLAAYIQAYLVQRTRMSNRGVKSASFHVIRNTTRNPAVLVECGFVSNPTERSRMMTGEFRARIAEGVAQGIVAYKKAR
jgi:N-acetylmuramoyl-L-alanine amidase